MNKKVSLGTAVTLMAIAAALAVAITMVYSIRTFNDKLYNIKEREATYEKLSQIDKIVRSQYFGEIDDKYLMDSIAEGYVEGIGDKYALYLTASQYRQQLEALEGQTVGVGISVLPDISGYMRVVEVYPDSSADMAGIQPDDLILKVDGLEITADTYEEAVELLEGEAGTKVTLELRQNNEDQEPVELTRRKIDVPTVYYSIVDDIGYIQILEFGDATPNQFNKAIELILSEGAKGLVFDVRNNPGGTIDSVSDVLDRLLPAGNIVSATYKDGTTEILAVSDSREVELPMAVVINQKTASAAELFAQALADYEKAATVGVTTYGKGLMQTIYKLDDGSALDITVAKYNPPKSPNFDGVGVIPAYEVKLTQEQELNLALLDQNTDPQLSKARELVQAAIAQKAAEEQKEAEDKAAS